MARFTSIQNALIRSVLLSLALAVAISGFVLVGGSAPAFAAEKMKLTKRQTSAENQRDRTKRFIAYLLHGQKFKNAKHSLYYLNTESLEITNEDDLVQWCKANAPGFLNEPTVRIDDLKQAIKRGLDCPFAKIQKNNSLVVR